MRNRKLAFAKPAALARRRVSARSVIETKPWPTAVAAEKAVVAPTSATVELTWVTARWIGKVNANNNAKASRSAAHLGAAVHGHRHQPRERESSVLPPRSIPTLNGGITVSYLDHTAAATAKAHAYVYEALGLNALDAIPDDYRVRNDYDARLSAFLAGVVWALDGLPNDAEGDRRV